MKILLKDKEGSFHPIEDISMAVHSKLIRNTLKYSDDSEKIVHLPSIEGKLLSIITSWVKDPESMKLDEYLNDTLVDLLLASEFMDMPFLSDNIISLLAKQMSSENVSELLNFAKNYIINDLEQLCWKFMQPINQNNLIFLLGGFKAGSPTSSMSVMDASTGVIANLPEQLPFTIAYSGAVMEKSHIYIVGGLQENGGESKSLFKLNVKDLSLTSLSKMSERRNYVSVAILDNFIYCIGGHTGTKRLRTAERYDINNNQWYDCGIMKEARSDAGAASLNGKIYVVGGFDGSQQHSSVEVFDPKDGTWTMGKPMFKKRSGVKVAAMNGKLYVVGGWSGGTRRLTCGEVFDPNTNKWKRLPEMNVPRSNYSLFVAHGKLVVTGGYDGSGLTQTTEILDPKKKEWVLGRNLMDATSATASVSIPEKMFSPELLERIRDLCKY